MTECLERKLLMPAAQCVLIKQSKKNRSTHTITISLTEQGNNNTSAIFP